MLMIFFNTYPTKGRLWIKQIIKSYLCVANKSSCGCCDNNNSLV